MSRRNEYLDHGLSDESDHEDGYDSEAAELSKGARSSNTTTDRNAKRRKLSHSESEDEIEIETLLPSTRHAAVKTSAEVNVSDNQSNQDEKETASDVEDDNSHDDNDEDTTEPVEHDYTIKSAATALPNNKESNITPSTTTKTPKSKTKDKKQPTPGVIYMSSLPPYLKPSALKNLLEKRSFGPITRLFLTPASKSRTKKSRKNSRQLYSEGWIEFSSKKTARRCAETLNATTVGGKKGGFYHDDVWNMKYLSGMRWSELMAGIREERREEEGRRDEERRGIARETKAFIEGVEEGRRVVGIKRKRENKKKIVGDDSRGGVEGGDGGGRDEIKRTWRQYNVKGGAADRANGRRGDGQISQDVQSVLGKIF